MRSKVFAVVVGLVLGITALALANDGDDPEAGDDSALPAPTVDYDPESGELDLSQVERSQEPNFVPANFNPSQQRVDECQAILDDPGSASNLPEGLELDSETVAQAEESRIGGCRLIVASAAGELEPGWYSNPELEAALDAAPSARTGG